MPNVVLLPLQADHALTADPQYNRRDSASDMQRPGHRAVATQAAGEIAFELELDTSITLSSNTSCVQGLGF